MTKILADSAAYTEKLKTVSDEIINAYPDISSLIIVGIQRRGVNIAKKIVEIINEKIEKSVPMGILDITFYRDDLSMVTEQPTVHDTKIPFKLEGKNVLLVDDVIYTGRTVRAALDAVIDFGRPKRIQLLALVDRGHRELPVQPDFTGWKIQTTNEEKISVKVLGIDGEDAVELIDM